MSISIRRELGEGCYTEGVLRKGFVSQLPSKCFAMYGGNVLCISTAGQERRGNFSARPPPRRLLTSTSRSWNEVSKASPSNHQLADAGRSSVLAHHSQTTRGEIGLADSHVELGQNGRFHKTSPGAYQSKCKSSTVSSLLNVMLPSSICLPRALLP